MRTRLAVALAVAALVVSPVAAGTAAAAPSPQPPRPAAQSDDAGDRLHDAWGWGDICDVFPWLPGC